jgi:hypothetical protein
MPPTGLQIHLGHMGANQTAAEVLSDSRPVNWLTTLLVRDQGVGGSNPLAEDGIKGK